MTGCLEGLPMSLQCLFFSELFLFLAPHTFSSKIPPQIYQIKILFGIKVVNNKLSGEIENRKSLFFNSRFLSKC